LDDYQNLSQKLADWTPVTSRAEVVVFDKHLSEAEAVQKLQDFDALCMLRERMPLPASLLDRLPRLKFIAVTGPYHRTLDMSAADRLGITVSCTPRTAAGQFSTAELAWGLLLAAARRIPAEDANMRKGGWQTTVGVSLATRTLGLVGLGRLGSHMVPIARAFGMNVLAWSPNLTAERASEIGATRVDKDELFARSDFISLHLVLGERSRGVVGRQELRLMKPDAYLINTARGPLVDRAALLDALSNRRIGGAALDVYDEEPLPADDPIRKLDNVVLLPHVGYTVKELLGFFYERTVENLVAFMDGKPLRVLTAEKPRLTENVVV
jgi:D-3-phosphoglycerate dehydrogenase